MNLIRNGNEHPIDDDEGGSMRHKLWISMVAVLAVLTLAAVACSSGNEATGSTGAAGGGGSQQSSQPTSTETSEGESGGGGGSEGEPDVVAEDFDFDPTDVSAASGSTLVVKNDSPSTPHTFTVDGTKIDQDLAPDTSSNVKIDLKAGTYPFHCTIHPQMTGTLTVT
jgi:plastocyanin